jgi:hypothetical protein
LNHKIDLLEKKGLWFFVGFDFGFWSQESLISLLKPI